uniref:Uncharacterized protein n=1 Tax=Anguilla anguilla TaxID=7936 RepID=A0A0E9XDV7_ANGAN
MRVKKCYVSEFFQELSSVVVFVHFPPSLPCDA